MNAEGSGAKGHTDRTPRDYINTENFCHFKGILDPERFAAYLLSPTTCTSQQNIKRAELLKKMVYAA